MPVLNNRVNKNRMERSQQKWGYIFIAPCIIGLIIFHFGPMLYSLFISFTRWDMITPARFIGMGNYRELLREPLVGVSIRVTLYYALLTVPLITVITFLIAILLSAGVRGISIFRTIFYIPSIVPVVASSALWLYIYNPMFGLLNSLFRSFGLPPQNFIFSPGGAVPGLAIMAVWMAGNTVVIYLAGLQGISRSLYEAADLDGANGFQRFFHITVPMMTPIIFYNMLMALIGAMQTFTQAFIMTSGGPNNASMFYSLYLYQQAFKYQKMGYASALSWVLFVIVAFLTALVFRSSRKWVFYENK
ncbi:MAG: sugar ABC transporter permease [Spirochaetaceae bacterium]|jgi:multiple sugar transport system permease protein|nr:sugar ABC transporter permease [Spirochaetaceae bacterium]